MTTINDLSIKILQEEKNAYELSGFYNNCIPANKHITDIKGNEHFKFICINNHNEIVGYLEFVSIYTDINSNSGKALSLKSFAYNTDKVFEILIREALMCCWEMNFDVVFTKIINPVLEKIGFSELNLHELTKMYYMELTWDGLKLIPEELLSRPGIYN